MATTNAPTKAGLPRRRPLWLKLLAGLVLLVALLAVGLAFFPWDVLREPVNRYVSEKTGRKFEITRRLDVGLGWRQATVRLDGIEFANPSWARDPYLVKAERADFDIRLWPLISSSIVIPRLALSSPTVGLQMEADGRRTWALGKEGKDSAEGGTVPPSEVSLPNAQVRRPSCSICRPSVGEKSARRGMTILLVTSGQMRMSNSARSAFTK